MISAHFHQNIASTLVNEFVTQPARFVNKTERVFDKDKTTDPIAFTPSFRARAGCSSDVDMVSTHSFDSEVKKPTETRPKQQFNEKPADQLRALTGSVERIIQWHRVYNKPCFYELIASIISIELGKIPQQKIMLLRDARGPIMQVMYYELDHIQIEDFHIGQILRCVGHMVGRNKFRAFKIRTATEAEVATLDRNYYMCERVVSMATGGM